METWRPVVGYAALYEVSDSGRVRSLPRMIPHRGGLRRVRGRMLAIFANRDGYSMVRLCDTTGGKGRHDRRIHRLVAEAFIGAAPDGRPEINHRDGDKSDCRPNNLEWVSRGENMAHASMHRLMSHGEAHPRSRLTQDAVMEIRRLCAAGMLHREIAALYGVARSTVSSVLCGDSWHLVESGTLQSSPAESTRLATA